MSKDNSKTAAMQRNNFAKLYASLLFTATTPDDRVGADDTGELRKVSAGAAANFLTDPAFAASYKVAQKNGWINEDGELTAGGQSAAISAFNARGPRNQYQGVDYEQLVAAQPLGGLFALVFAAVKGLQEKIEGLKEFTPSEKVSALFDEAGNILLDMSGKYQDTVDEIPTSEPTVEVVEEEWEDA